MTDEERDTFLKFLRDLKVNKKDYSTFEESLGILQNYAATKGLIDEDIDLLADIIINTELGATKLVSLAKCLVPRHEIPERTVKSLISWCLASINELPITVSTIIIQWTVGILDYQLIDKKVINIYYSVFFYMMLKKERLERHIARIIYVLTKPEDVTRRDVSRLLNLHQKYLKPRKHIIVLLSLFKSYKPELVPEKIQSINTESVWKPIPEILRLMLQDAKSRLESQQTQDLHSECFNWNVFEFMKTKKTVAPLLPPVGYFQIGSNIFKEKDTKSIFEISSTEELGKLHLSVELPCNAISLLSNIAGYHLLTFADFHYQSRFSYNLYNTLVRAFILENEKFSTEEINKLLDITIEFSQYMQQDILVVNRFLDEYLYFNTGEYQSKLLVLLQWMTSVSISDLQEKILVHVQNMFYESTLSMKCEIIRTLKMLITNLFVSQAFEECSHKTPAPFLGQGAVDNLEEAIPILTKTTKTLIVSGLNIHSYDILLLSEALSFYEEICILENRSTIMSFTLAPPAVIYGGFITKHCAILSKVCKLLLRYRNRCLQLKNRKIQKLYKKKFNTISIYAQDIVEALWYDEPFKKRSNMYFLRNVPTRAMEDLKHCNLNCLLNISNHYAILPYKCILNKTGLSINTREAAMSVALYYYPTISEFLDIFQN
uniref:centromere protein I-like isoform X1 n=2 Tax=Bombus vancouverensis nearcticus TaxID=2705178 RepID=UPI00143AF856|nr:centromere protein I-like isoform X1 [Bombus vancouverensis nearcticus]